MLWLKVPGSVCTMGAKDLDQRDQTEQSKVVGSRVCSLFPQTSTSQYIVLQTHPLKLWVLERPIDETGSYPANPVPDFVTCFRVFYSLASA